MPNGSDLSGLSQYSVWPLVVAAVLVASVLAAAGVIAWSTRKKPLKTVATLPKASAPVIDLAALRQKYLQLIDQLEAAYARREISARSLHQQLSVTLRLFVREATGYKADVMTLADIKRNAKLKRLASPIESYYEPEFAAALSGNVQHALAEGKEMISSWS